MVQRPSRPTEAPRRGTPSKSHCRPLACREEGKAQHGSAVERNAVRIASPELLLVGREHPLRKATEDCIREVYARTCGARLTVFPDLLFAACGREDALLCAAGLRFGDEGYFSECYLDQPIESLLGAHAGQRVARSSIFEITTLVSRAPDVSAAFLRRIGRLGRYWGFEWAFFTASERLRELLRGMGIPLILLGEAQPGRVSHPEAWGSYYRCAPRVCAIDGRGIAAPLRPAAVVAGHA